VIGLDAYTARARLGPAALAALPALALLGGGLLAPSEVAKLGTTAIAAVLLVASQLSRDAGRRLQPALWES
jgi:Flp pilus assembly protein TadB